MIKNWPLIPLDNLVTKVGSGSTPKGGETVYKSEGVPFIRSMNVVFFGFKHTGLAFLDNKQADGLKNAEVKALDILLNITGASIGRVTLAPKSLEGARVNQHVCIIRPNEALEPRFLNAYFSSPAMQSRIWADNYGVTRQALTKQQILDFEIPLAPLPEQKRNADKLDATLARVDVCRERLARVAPILKRFRQSVLAAAVSGRLTADWRAQQAGGDNIPLTTESPDQPAVIEPASCNQAQTRSPDAAQRNPGNNAANSSGINPDFGQLALGAQPNSLAKLHQLFDIHSGFAFKKGQYSASGSKLLQIANIGYGETLWDEIAYIPTDLACGEFSRFSLQQDDLVMALNRPITNGMLKVAKISISDLPATLYQRVACLRAKNPRNTKYLFLALQSPAFLKQVESNLQGSDQPYINSSSIAQLEVPVHNTTEQHEIVRRVESLFAFADRLEARLAAAQTAAEQLTPALLAKAFRGELVPQDPADEPASELLKRLAASRASADKPKRGRTPRQPA